jgi:hypothetical protein
VRTSFFVLDQQDRLLAAGPRGGHRLGRVRLGPGRGARQVDAEGAALAGAHDLLVAADVEVGLVAVGQQVAVGSADRLARGGQPQVAGALLVAAEVDAVAVLPEDGAGDVGDELLEEGALLLQGQLGLFALADVAGGDQGQGARPDVQGGGNGKEGR